MAIDVGSSAGDRALSVSPSLTLIDFNNAANATGLITSVSIYSNVALEGIKVASFFSTALHTFSTRDSVSLANQGGAGLTTYTAPTDFSPFEIRTGDYIGFYCSAGRLDADSGPGSGIYDFGGDGIPCTEQAFILYPGGDDLLSLSATGVQLGQINIGDAWKTIQNIQINVGDSWKQLCDMEINIGDVWKKGVY